MSYPFANHSLQLGLFNILSAGTSPWEEDF